MKNKVGLIIGFVLVFCVAYLIGCSSSQRTQAQEKNQKPIYFLSKWTANGDLSDFAAVRLIKVDNKEYIVCTNGVEGGVAIIPHTP